MAVQDNVLAPTTTTSGAQTTGFASPVTTAATTGTVIPPVQNAGTVDTTSFKSKTGFDPFNNPNKEGDFGKGVDTDGTVKDPGTGTDGGTVTPPAEPINYGEQIKTLRDSLGVIVQGGGAEYQQWAKNNPKPDRSNKAYFDNKGKFLAIKWQKDMAQWWGKLDAVAKTRQWGPYAGVSQSTAQVVPGKPNPNVPGQINVVDYSGQILNDPTLFFRKDDPSTPENESMTMSDHLSKMNVENGLVDGNASWAQMDPDKYQVTAGTVDSVAKKDAATYDVQKSQETVKNNQMTAAKGTLSDGSKIAAETVDMKGVATGVNEDGTINYTGQALNKVAIQDFKNIIDTSTVAGKMLAETLGEGNYLDSKATLKGQLEILQGEFVDQNTGEPRIPSWAAATARNVSKIAAFKGMGGTAATAAMSQALLEASIPIAQEESKFFQTMTLQNLSNRQQQILNTANVLAKFEQTNVDNRMAAAIQNSKAFLEMDMANLSNEQQSRVVNNQALIQSILEDSKQENAKRLFVADNENEMNKFYDNLNTQIAQFNVSTALDADKFNANMSDSREKFYKEMQYNINIANAKWRQTVEIQEDQQQFEAAALDVKNMFDISTNALNQIWDRSDSLLDYAWQSSEKEKDRRAAIAQIILQGQIAADAAEQAAWGSLMGLAVSDILNLGGRAGGSTILGWFS